jgi:thiamine biosynthesis lipoprotein ApbE
MRVVIYAYLGKHQQLIYIRNPINPLLVNAIGNMKNIAIASSGNYLQASFI